MRRLLILVVLALAIPAEAARADTGSIAINSAVGDYATATFTVNKTTCASLSPSILTCTGSRARPIPPSRSSTSRR